MYSAGQSFKIKKKATMVSESTCHAFLRIFHQNKRIANIFCNNIPPQIVVLLQVLILFPDFRELLSESVKSLGRSALKLTLKILFFIDILKGTVSGICEVELPLKE